ncbi:hypothetical protein GGER_45540 [Serratia rubidaea]
MTSKNLDTTLIGAGRSKRYTHGAVNPVTQRASSLVFDSVADKSTPRRSAPTANCSTAAAAP